MALDLTCADSHARCDTFARSPAAELIENGALPVFGAAILEIHPDGMLIAT